MTSVTWTSGCGARAARRPAHCNQLQRAVPFLRLLERSHGVMCLHAEVGHWSIERGARPVPGTTLRAMAASEMSTPGTVVYRETVDALKELRRTIQGKASSGTSSLSWSDEEVAAIRKIARRHQRCTDRLHRIWGGESKEKREHTRDVYLSAYTTRVCATVRAFAKTKRRGTVQDIYRFAGKLDVGEPLWEPVRVKVLPKSKGGYRTITRDGPRRMAQRFMVRDLLTAVGVDNEFDYCRRDAGGEKAMIRNVCERIEKGYRHWRTADVVNCFASVKPAHLGWLPLPKELIRNVVFLPRCAKIEIVEGPVGKEVSQSGTPTVSGVSIPYMGSSLVPMKKLRRELPQGSVLSPLVARAFLGRELRAVPGKKASGWPACLIGRSAIRTPERWIKDKPGNQAVGVHDLLTANVQVDGLEPSYTGTTAMAIVPLPLPPGAEARALLHHIIEHADIVGTDTVGRTFILRAVDGRVLERLMTFDADAAELEPSPTKKRMGRRFRSTSCRGNW
jgi:hypothetical protein